MMMTSISDIEEIDKLEKHSSYDNVLDLVLKLISYSVPHFAIVLSDYLNHWQLFA
jgi:hypothetical protein